MTDQAPCTVVMATTSYPRFPGDGVGSFIEPIAHGVAARGHDVHIVAPWHPAIRRPATEGQVHFHFFRYAPHSRLNVFGYAHGLKADVSLRPSAYLVTPLALAAWRRTLRQVARRHNASVIHAHWVVPGGFLAAVSQLRQPLIISLHGSDVFVAEANPAARAAARYAFSRADWITACSEDLRRRAVALGANQERTTVVPYGVDTNRFAPNPTLRATFRAERAIGDDDPLVVAAGRLVRKKGFEYLIDAVALLRERWPTLTLLLVGGGDLEAELRARAESKGVGDAVTFPGALTQDQVASALAAADVVAVPSVRDDAGNVDGLPNIVLEGLASGTPVVATPAGGISTVARDGITACVVAERDPRGLAKAIDGLLRDPALRTRLGTAARASIRESHTWSDVAEQLESAYRRITEAGA